MKKQFVIAGLLVALDQLVKVYIAAHALGQRIVLIPGIFRFEPFQNTNLNWFASMANVVAPVFLMVLFQLIVTAALVLYYRYQRYQRAKVSVWLSLGFCMALAGVACSFIDVVFWHGSLDYVGLMNWFIFDMKDVFLNAGWISIFIWICSKDYKTGTNKDISFKSWLKSGCKAG